MESYQNFDDGDGVGLYKFDLLVPTDVSFQFENILLNLTAANALRHRQVLPISVKWYSDCK